MQLFGGDRCGGATDPGGGAGHRHTVELADPGGVLTLLCHKSRVIKSPGNHLNATRVTWEQHVASNVALLKAKMVNGAVGLKDCHAWIMT